DGIELIDEAGGVIRAAARLGGLEPEGAFARVVLLDALSPRLRELGRSAPFAPEANLRCAHYFDDVALVSASREWGTGLNLLDLSQHEAPLVAGHVATSAPSSFLLPLPGGRLLGIGEAYDEEVGFNVALQ